MAAGETGSLYNFVVPSGSRFKMVPAATVDAPERYGTVRYEFNSAGYRDRNHIADGRQRIVLLGDSITFGLGVAQDRIYAAILQNELNAHWGPRYDVVNLAIFAYHSGHELDALRDDGVRHDPVLVVAQFYMNDLAQPAADRPTGKVARPTIGHRLVATKNRYIYRSALYRKVHQAASRLTYLLGHDLRRTRFPGTLNEAEPRSKIAFLRQHPDDASIPAFRSLLAMRATSAAAGAHFLVLVTPDETQLFSRRFDEIDRRLAHFCSRNGIALYNALPDLRAVGRPETLFLDGVHLSPRGHEIVGSHLAARLRESGLVSHR